MKHDPNRPEDELLRKLSAFRDGELPPAEAQRLRDLLAADEDARRTWEEMEALDEMLGQWPAPPVADVRGAVMARVRQDLARRPRRWVPLAWAASWMLGGVLTGLSLWTGIDQRINDQIAAESLSQDMTLSMIMTEDWTPSIAIDEVPQP